MAKAPFLLVYYVLVVVWELLCFIPRFVWYLFKFIHSEKRVLCGIDGTLGGTISYACFTSTSMPFAEQVLLAVFGGLLGAVIGVANWEIVSKRILHVQVERV
jgi:hypothetical protein